MDSGAAGIEERVREIILKKNGKAISDAKVGFIINNFKNSSSVEALIESLSAELSPNIIKKIGSELERLFQELKAPLDDWINLSEFLAENDIEPDDLEDFKQMFKDAIKNQNKEQFDESLNFVSPKEAGLLKQRFLKLFLTGEEPQMEGMPKTAEKAVLCAPVEPTSENFCPAKETPPALPKFMANLVAPTPVSERPTEMVKKVVISEVSCDPELPRSALSSATADSDVRYFCLIESFLDSGDGYEIQKFKLNESQILDLVKLANTSLLTCGYFGDMEECLQKGSEYLGAPIPKQHFNAVNPTTLTLAAVLKGNRLAMILQSHPSLFGKAFNRKSPLVELLRYLMDTCNCILMCIPKGTRIEKGESWLKVAQESTCTLQATELKENDKLNLSKHEPGFKNKFLSYTLIQTDCPKLVFAETKTKMTSTPITIQMNKYNYNFEDWLKLLIPALELKCGQKTFHNLGELMAVVYKNLQPFMTHEILQIVERALQEELQTNHDEEFSRASATLMSNSSLNDFSMDIPKGDEGLIATLTNYIFPPKKKKGFKISGYKGLVSWNFLEELLAANCIKSRNSHSTLLEISLAKFYIVKDFDGSVQKTNIEEDILKVVKEIPSGSSVRMVDFSPCSEDGGFFLINNFPTNMTSLFSYTKSFESQASVQVCTYPSPEYRLVLNPNVLLYFIYDNKNFRASWGRVSKAPRLQEGKNVDIFDRLKDKTNHIASATILTCNENILILDNNGILYNYVPSSDKLNQISKLDESHLPIPIMPPNPKYKYKQVQSSSSGKLVYLLWDKGLDVYDGNYYKLTEILLEDRFVAFKPLFDAKHGMDFLLLQYSDRFTSFLLTGIESSISLEFSRSQAKDLAGQGAKNPIIDYIYIAADKFGPHTPEISCPERTLLSVLSREVALDEVEAYMDHLEIPAVRLNGEFHPKQVRPSDPSELKFLILSRIPIHIASIQNYTLVPLSNGEYQSDKFFKLLQHNEEGKSQINKICENIRFGHFEEFIRGWKGSISVVSMVGKQSSGKSYMLNRLFGTRFNVAGTRCTDGIWMSMSFLKSSEDQKMLVIVLDCEGLFSIVRSTNEETKLCLALAAVSDVLIINQDLSYNRNLNELMSNLKDNSNKLSGAQLFKGCMAFFVRDVVEKSFNDAQQEFESNMKTLCSVPNNFVTQIFGGRVINCLFPYFELKSFDRFVKKSKATCAEQLVKTLSRWGSGEDFLFSLKIVLSQLMIDDDISLDEHKAKIKAERLIELLMKAYHEGIECPEFKESVELVICRESLAVETANALPDPDSFLVCLNEIAHDSTFKLESSASVESFCASFHTSSEFDDEASAREKEVKVEFKHSDIFIEKEQEALVGDLAERATPAIEGIEGREDELPEFLTQFPFQSLLAMINASLGVYEQNYHNEWVKEAQKVIALFFDTRENAIKNLFERLFKDEAGELKESIKRELEAHLEKYRRKVKICSKTCRMCSRNCFSSDRHDNDCDCQTDHLCKDPCTAKAECKENKKLCCRQFGHTGGHACNSRHKCPETCSVEGCEMACQHDPGHAELEHDCKNRHPCRDKCSQAECKRSCGQDCGVKHDRHECGENQCSVKCALCDERCSEMNHFHSESITKTCSALDHHNCGKAEHNCPNKCQTPGVCSIKYEPVDKEIANGDGKISYTYMKPIKTEGQCTKTVPKGVFAHGGNCKCLAEIHRCDARCPECGSFCLQEFGHNGPHSTSNHRNKEYCKFVSTSKAGKIALVSEGAKRVYNPGETCEPENCTDSCKRKFRAHFHLKECLGPERCAQKFNPRVQHSAERYHPFESKVFDKWLCKDYWDSLGWQPPVAPETVKTNSLCNSYCVGCHTNKAEVPSVFCELPALHDGPHKISCCHGALGNGQYQVAFVLDSTGSMGSYIAKAKVTIASLVNKFKDKNSKAKLEFGFVDYKDHPPQDSTYVTKVKEFCSDAEMLAHIAAINASGGGDTPEAVIDGLCDATNKLAWKSDYNKFIFHIGDAPPHGTRYTNDGDGFPGGCPCGKTIENVSKTMNDKNIQYCLFKIGSGMNKMDDIFKSCIKQYQSHSTLSPEYVDTKITDILVADLESAELDVIG